MNLLLLPIHFELLFAIMSRLSEMKSSSVQDQRSLTTKNTKAQLLSRRVWDILLLLPTSPHLKESLQNIHGDYAANDLFKKLLDPGSPQKLMYTLYIVDWLGRPVRLRRHSGVAAVTRGVDFEGTFCRGLEGKVHGGGRLKASFLRVRLRGSAASFGPAVQRW